LRRKRRSAILRRHVAMGQTQTCRRASICGFGSNYIVCGQRTTDALKRKLAHWLAFSRVTQPWQGRL
jgi:hypothetical protein